MIGKVVVRAKNPPCRDCGGMAGYHSKDCAADHAVVPRKFTKAWFRANGAKGGAARAKSLSKEQLTAIAQLGVEARAKKRPMTER